MFVCANFLVTVSMVCRYVVFVGILLGSFNGSVEFEVVFWGVSAYFVLACSLLCFGFYFDREGKREREQRRCGFMHWI